MTYQHKQVVGMANTFLIIISALIVATQQWWSVVTSSKDLDRKFWNLPDFSDSNRGNNILLADCEPWIPSRTDQLTFLSPSQPLRVELRLNIDGQQSVIESCDLLYKCNAGDVTDMSLKLIAKDPNHQWKVSNPLCTSELGFVVERQNATSYRIKILPESKVPFNQSLHHYMEFSIRIRYREGMLNSAKLYAFSLLSLFNINSEERSSSSGPFRQFFLTHEAVAFLMGRNFTNEKLDTSIVAIKFLDKSLLDVVNKAPNIIRSLLTVTVSLKHAHTASKLTDGREVLLSNGQAENQAVVDAAVSSNGNNDTNDVRHGLSLITGKLLIDRSFLIKITQEWDKQSVHVILRVSINGLRNNSEVEKTVTIYNATFLDLKLPVIASSALWDCQNAEELKHSNVTLIPFYAGMRDIVLTARGVCPCHMKSQRDCTLDYNVQYRYEDGENDHHPSGGPKGIRRFQDKKNVVTLKGPRGLEDMGHYVFVMRDMPSHEYQLIDANLPRFEALPDVINVNKNAALHLECKLRRTGNGYTFVHMSSHFQVFDHRTGEKWSEFNLDEFAANYLLVPPSKIKKIKIPADEFHGYKLVFPTVDHMWGMWRITYICRAEITVSDVKTALGLAKYQFEVRAPVRYHGFGETVMRNSRLHASSLVSQRSAITPACFAVATIAAVHWTVLYY